MTRLILGLLLGLLLGAPATAAAQHFDPLASGRQFMREQQERHDRFNEQFQAQQQAHELQMLRLEIQRQGQQQELQRQQEAWRSIGGTERPEPRRWDYRRRFLNED